MCTEITTFDVDNATKNYEKIIVIGPYKWSGMGYHLGAAYSKQFLSIICHIQPVKGGVLTKNFENKLCRNIHVICYHFGAYPPTP